jgi:sugar lactone lactonase YvrE
MRSMPATELILKADDVVGESLVWSPEERALYWIDIVGSRIHRLEPHSGAHRTWQTPEYPTSIGLRRGGGFVVGLRRRVTLWQPDTAFETLAVPEPDLPGNRLNEGCVAPDGSFWVGTMQENIGPGGAPKEMTAHSGAIYRVTAAGEVTRLTEPTFGITNTMVWLDDERFVTADTLKNELYQYGMKNGALAGRRLFAKLDRGRPDGSTRDAEGNIYNARVAGGSAIARLSPAGALLEYLDLPCASPTSCTFGGADLSTLFVTSSSFGLSAEQRAAAPQEGSLFAIETPWRGGIANRFG